MRPSPCSARWPPRATTTRARPSSFATAIAHLFPNSNVPYAPPAVLPALDAAWPVLDALDPRTKGRFVEAMVAAVLDDGVLAPAEAELVRTACALLHCPLPALLDPAASRSLSYERANGRQVSVRRVMGTEVEYGVSLPGQPSANAMLLSAQVVNAYASDAAGRPGTARQLGLRGGVAAARRARVRPRRQRARVAQEFIDAEEDAGMANVILPNGARLYVDHAHPEYSSPEVTNPLDAVRWDKAGELVMLEAARRVATMPGVNAADQPLQEQHRQQGRVLRRARELPVQPRHAVRRRWSATSCRSSSPVRSSAAPGGSGSVRTGAARGFQISQRADFFEVEVGLETTLKRPIVNTRDEPHADADRYRRLHVIIGDANLAEISTYLKVGTTALVLAMIEDNFLGRRPQPSPSRCASCTRSPTTRR